MGDPGLVAIAAAYPNLKVLYLSRASDCTDDGVSAIANSCRKLRKLHIDAWSRFGSRTIGDDEPDGLLSGLLDWPLGGPIDWLLDGPLGGLLNGLLGGPKSP